MAVRLVPPRVSRIADTAGLVATLTQLLTDARAGAIISLAYAVERPQHVIVTDWITTRATDKAALAGAVAFLGFRVLQALDRSAPADDPAARP